jgi:hypothetical protein
LTNVSNLTSASNWNSQLENLIHGGGKGVFASNDGTQTYVPQMLASGLTTSDTDFLQKFTGIPFDSFGNPDFDAARASGKKIQSGIPGGFDVSGIGDGQNVVEFFAGQVASDRQSGALTGDINSHYVKGMMLSLSPNGSEANHRQFAQMAMNYLNKLGPDDVVGSAHYTPRATFETTVVGESSFERRA